VQVLFNLNYGDFMITTLESNNEISQNHKQINTDEPSYLNENSTPSMIDENAKPHLLGEASTTLATALC